MYGHNCPCAEHQPPPCPATAAEAGQQSQTSPIHRFQTVKILVALVSTKKPLNNGTRKAVQDPVYPITNDLVSLVEPVYHSLEPLLVLVKLLELFSALTHCDNKSFSVTDLINVFKVILGSNETTKTQSM